MHKVAQMIKEDRDSIMNRTWSTVIRSLLIIVNILPILPGCLLIYSCFTISAGDSNNSPTHSLFASQTNPVFTYSVVLGSAVGAVIVLVALLGLYAAIKRSKSLLATYATIQSIVVLLLVVMVIFTYTLGASKSKMRNEQLDESIVNSTIAMYNYVDTSDPRTTFADFVQKKFSCCGLNSPNDWMEYSYHKIPKSCCLEPVESSLPVFKYCAESDYKIGCWRPLMDYFFETVLPITRDFILIKIYYNVACTALACLLIRSIKKDLDVV